MDLLKESVKNNPTAIEYFIKYEVLSTCSLLKSYQNFCKAVGNDVMDYTEFQSQSLKFTDVEKIEVSKEMSESPKPLTLRFLPVNLINPDWKDFPLGRFNKLQNTMTPLKKSVRNNPTALRYFIQYEVLLKKPIFNSYRFFCELIGDDVMDYPEFEFWFMRFYNGKVELDYDRSQDPKQLTFSDLPLEMVNLIVGNLGIEDRILARLTSKSLQTIVDGQKLKIDHISFCIEPKDGIWLYGRQQEIARYWKTEKGGCGLIFSQGKHDQENQIHEIKAEIEGGPTHPLLIAFNHLKTILINPESSVKSFEVNCGACDTGSLRILQKITDKCVEKFNVERINCESIEVFSCFLKILNPEILKKVYMDTGRDKKLGWILSTKHFKNAETWECGGYIQPEEIHHFNHFKKFLFCLETAVTKEILVDLKQAIEKSTIFKQCTIHSPKQPTDEELGQVFELWTFGKKGLLASIQTHPDPILLPRKLIVTREL